MVATGVDDLGVMLLHHPHHDADKLGMFFLPDAILLELPTVDDIAVKDQLVAAVHLQEVNQLLRF